MRNSKIQCQNFHCDGNYYTLANNFIDEFGKTENAFGSSHFIFYADKYERAANETIKDFYTVTTEPHKLHFPIEIYRYPLYIHIVFKPCPLGFHLSQSQCSCNSLLQQIPTVECNIQTQSISCHGSVWVGLYNINSSIIAASQYCPLNYCKEEPVQLNFDSNENVSQCNFRRSGVLCGGCEINFVFISQTQSWVLFKNGACQNLNYTVFSSCDICKTVLMLTPDQRKVPQPSHSNFNEKLKIAWSKLLSDEICLYFTNTNLGSFQKWCMSKFELHNFFKL